MITVYLNLRNTLKSLESIIGKPIAFQAIHFANTKKHYGAFTSEAYYSFADEGLI